ncbi:MAG: transcriptional repressor [Gemmatimonadota bacterium]
MSHDQMTLDAETVLRHALEAGGQRYTEQRGAVFTFVRSTRSHPTADEVFTNVRREIPDISLATVYKSLETLVGCGLAVKLAYGDGSARYDGRTDPHHHARCTRCGLVLDVPGDLPTAPLPAAAGAVDGFQVRGYRLELLGHCSVCQAD